MSRIAAMLIDIEEMLTSGYTSDNIAKTLNVPIDWVIETEKEMMGLNNRGFDDGHYEGDF